VFVLCGDLGCDLGCDEGSLRVENTSFRDPENFELSRYRQVDDFVNSSYEDPSLQFYFCKS
jgi:hypothetical protein